MKSDHGPADGIFVMSACTCRTVFKCQQHPRNLGCLQLGPAARGIPQELGKGNEFCKKITYPNSYKPRIAVTVEMIATGTDIKPLECLIFLRMVKSQGNYCDD